MRFAAALFLLALAPGAASAQDDDAGYREGDARGFAYGAYLVSPIHAMPLERNAGAESLGPGGGAGLQVRVGYELPEGFLLELYGGFAANEIAAAPMEDPTRSHVLMRGDVALGVRYNLYTDTPIVPFARLGGGMRMLFFTWGSDVDKTSVFAPFLGLTVGMQIALAPFFGVELGAIVDYTFGMDAFDAGFLDVAPFAGITLYLYDETDPVTAP